MLTQHYIKAPPPTDRLLVVQNGHNGAKGIQGLVNQVIPVADVVAEVA